MNTTSFTIICILALSACSGPGEQAGKKADKAAAAALGVAYSGSGPNQRIGAAQDRAAAAAQQVRNAAAATLTAQSADIKRHADVDAARFEEQAKAVRDAADKRADDLEAQARAARK